MDKVKDPILQQQIEMDVYLFGNAFIETVKNKKGKIISEKRLDPLKVRFKKTKDLLLKKKQTKGILLALFYGFVNAIVVIKDWCLRGL